MKSLIDTYHKKKLIYFAQIRYADYKLSHAKMSNKKMERRGHTFTHAYASL